MLKWIAKTIILIVLVAVGLIIYQTPNLREKTKHWAKDRAEFLAQRAEELKRLLAKKGSEEISQGKQKVEEKVKEEIKKIIIEPEPTKDSSDKASKAPAQASPSQSAPPMQEPIPEKDRKELEKILEKAEKVSPSGP